MNPKTDKRWKEMEKVKSKTKVIKVQPLKGHLVGVSRNDNSYGGKYWISESWGKRFSTPEEERVIEKLGLRRFVL